MTRALQLAAIAALGTFILCGVAATWEWHLTNQATRTAEYGALASEQKVPDLTATVAKANSTLDTVNAGAKDVFAESRAVTIAMVDKGRPGKPETMGLIPAVKFMAEDADEQVKQSAKLVDASTAAIAGAAQDVHTMAVAGTATLGTAQTTIQSLQGPIQGLSVSENNFNALLKSKAVTEFVANLGPLSDNAVSMSASGAAMLKDAQWKTHQLLHPDKVKLTFWGGTWAFAKYLHEFEPPIF